MPTELQIAEHRKAQLAAKSVLAQLEGMITPQDTEASIAGKAQDMLVAAGYPDTWYYQCPALVLLGSRSCMSVSGKSYQASEEKVGLSNLITIDLSPTLGDCWGDCARSFMMEDGEITSAPQSLEFKNGTQFLQRLQAEMRSLIQPQVSFGQLFEWTNVRIRESGFVNLDYRGNVGHSIATSREDRQFIQANNPVPLGHVPFFSFEPFVRLKGGKWGFKHEDIFFFDQSGVLQLL